MQGGKSAQRTGGSAAPQPAPACCVVLPLAPVPVPLSQHSSAMRSTSEQHAGRYRAAALLEHIFHVACCMYGAPTEDRVLLSRTAIGITREPKLVLAPQVVGDKRNGS